MKLRDKTMKLSEKTLTLLKNFSNINQSILFKQGSSLRTISVMKNILAEATIDEDLPTDFGIYDLVTITETDLQVTGGYTDTYTELNADGTYTETSVEITETLTFARVDDEDE